MNQTAGRPKHPYNEWALWYDAGCGDREEYVRYYAAAYPVTASRFADLGCGTGTVTVAVAQKLRERNPGLQVYGADLSLPMLRMARGRAPWARWIQADLMNLPYFGSIDAAMCAYNTLQHVPPSRLSAAIEAIRAALSFDATLVFDIYNPNLSAISRAYDRKLVRVVDYGGRPSKVYESSSFDADRSLLSVDWTLESVDGDRIGRVQFDLWQHRPDATQSALKQCGFEIEAAHGDFDESPFHLASKKQIYRCRAR
jgi:ubiquinone/menaquinone biosynthesis C-methylase UbiE